MHKTPEEKIEQIRDLYRKGITQEKIKEITGASINTIYKYTREDNRPETARNKMPEEFRKEWDEARQKILKYKKWEENNGK